MQIIEYNTHSCYEHITGGVDIYLYRCVSVLAPVCTVCIICQILKSSARCHIKNTPGRGEEVGKGGWKKLGKGLVGTIGDLLK